MKRLALLFGFAALLCAQPATVNVSQILYKADGTPYRGSVFISWPTFDTALGEHVPAGTKQVNLTSAGLLTVSLAPNVGALPTGVSYTVAYKLDLGQSRTVAWIVPASGPVTVTAIESTTLVGPSSIVALTQLGSGSATNGQCPIWNTASGAWVPGACSGSVGTLTTISGSGPSWLTWTITNSTTTPAISLAATTGQTPHQVIGTCGAATTFGPCPLVAGDIPNLPQYANACNAGQPGSLASTCYNFTPLTPGGTLTGSSPATLTITCPVGVNGADTHHYLYVSGGTGTAEAVLITGGTCTSGAAGTLTFTPANNHSGAWTLGSATAGIQEAVMALPPDPSNTSYTRGTVIIPEGTYAAHAGVNVTGNLVVINGASRSTKIVFDSTIPNPAFFFGVDSQAVYVDRNRQGLHHLTIVNNSTTQDSVVWHWNDSVEDAVSDVTISGGRRGLFLDQEQNSSFKDIVIVGFTTHGVYDDVSHDTMGGWGGGGENSYNNILIINTLAPTATPIGWYTVNTTNALAPGTTYAKNIRIFGYDYTEAIRVNNAAGAGPLFWFGDMVIADGGATTSIATFTNTKYIDCSQCWFANASASPNTAAPYGHALKLDGTSIAKFPSNTFYAQNASQADVQLVNAPDSTIINGSHFLSAFEPFDLDTTNKPTNLILRGNSFATGLNMAISGQLATFSSAIATTTQDSSPNYSLAVVDASLANHTLPEKVGTIAGKPATCTVGEKYFATDAAAGQNDYFCTATNTWTQQLNSGAGGASTALGNLASVSINTSLLAQTGVDLGSTVKPFRNIFLFGAGTFATTYFELTGTPTSTRVWTVPDVTDTFVGIAATQTLTNKTLTSPTMTAPALGVATATSINKVAITAPATSATLTIPDGVTMTGPAASGTVATLGNTNTLTGRQDATGAASTAPMKTGTSLPGTCIVGDTYFKSDATAGQNIYQCQSTNTWTQQLNSGGGSAFTGSTATSSTGITGTATNPIISLADQSVKSPNRFEMGTLAANAATFTINNKTPGAAFSLVYVQASSGGPYTVNLSSAVTGTPTCQIDPTPGSTTTIPLAVGADGTTVNGSPCGTSSSVAPQQEQAAPSGTPASGYELPWLDSTGLFPRWKNSAGTFFQGAKELTSGNIRKAGGANTADSAAAAADVYGLFSGTHDSTHCTAGDGTMQACAGGGGSGTITTVSHLHDMAAGSFSAGVYQLVYAQNAGVVATCNGAADANFVPTIIPSCYLLWGEDGTSVNTRGVVIQDQVPTGYTSGAVKLTLKWSDHGSTGTYQWKTAYAVSASGTTFNPPTFSTPQNFSSQATTASDIYVQTVTLTGISFVAGDHVAITIGRVDSSNYAHLYQAVVEYTIP